MTNPTDHDLEIEHRGALIEIALNRPKALNALNDDMRSKLLAPLRQWQRDPDVYAVAIYSKSERAFCAGGDVRELVRLAEQDPDLAAASFGQEYLMNWTLECFSKPMVSLIDGMVMGSGVGLILYGTHRVAGRGFKFSMPETAIGLFPDVGVCHMLSRLPGHLGRYIGLSGRAISRKAAYRLGILTHCIDGAHFGSIRDRLADADTVDPILDGLHTDPVSDEPDELAGREALIDDLFGRPTLGGVFSALEQRCRQSTPDADWCAELLCDLKSRSPMSLHITFRHLDQSLDLDLPSVLGQDYRIAVRCLAAKDFREGVRALLVDKDNSPAWQHGSIDAVAPSEVDAYFAPLSNAELDLPTRAEMQNLKAS